jgi:hypothetical protein
LLFFFYYESNIRAGGMTGENRFEIQGKAVGGIPTIEPSSFYDRLTPDGRKDLYLS